jgi:hypothetical protein
MQEFLLEFVLPAPVEMTISRPVEDNVPTATFVAQPWQMPAQI